MAEEVAGPVGDNDERLAALAHERESYVARGLDDRVAAVDAEIERLGGAVPDSAGDGPRRRRTPRGAATTSVRPPETR